MSDARFQCFLIGSESLLLSCAERLQESGHAILGVITDAPPVVAWCAARGVTAIPLRSDYIARLAAQPFDYLLSITNHTIVPAEALALPLNGAINFHDGPLPRYGGVHATSWALMGGESEHGITWHAMTPDIDGGNIILQRRFAVAPDDTAFTLNAKCFEAAVESFPTLLETLSRRAFTTLPHQVDRSTFHARAARPAALGAIDWSAPAVRVAAGIRALDFGSYANPLASARIVVDGRSVRVGHVRLAGPTQAVPGTVLQADGDGLSVATADAALLLSGISTEDGQPLDAVAALTVLGSAVGDVLPPIGHDIAEALDAFGARSAVCEAAWVRRLASLQVLDLAEADAAPDDEPRGMRHILAPSRDRDSVAATFAILMARIAGRTEFDIGLRDDAVLGVRPPVGGIVAHHVPLRVSLSGAVTVADAHDCVAQALAWVRRRGGFSRDLGARRPAVRDGVASLRRMPVGIAFVDRLEEHPVVSHGLTLVLARNGATAWDYDPARVSAARLATLTRQFTAALAAAATSAWRGIPLMSATERRLVLRDWAAGNATEPSVDCVHEVIARQVLRTPDATALICHDETMTYAELDARANRLAQQLQVLGAGPDGMVAIACDRSLDMMVAVLGTLKSGAAYVPIDPAYPAERVSYMLEDAQARIVLTREGVLSGLPETRAAVICLDRDWDRIEKFPAHPPVTAVTAAHLAYCIYTSGSTGRPKGVMVEHRNVTNLFTAMDARLGTVPGVWLAVTSLSFDISVLELLWTLSRGYSVVIQPDAPVQEQGVDGLEHTQKPVDFSLFYFSADSTDLAADRYRVLLEGARFGDRHGFTAVWTPERHFHAFGGLYPNPAVTGAAVAAVTERIGIRAGSCVLPLHHPIRVAEEWSIVDNLSGGRVGVSFAAGWQPNDFVLNPGSYAEAKTETIALMETVRRLWRGDAVVFPGPRGDVNVRTLPRPVQPELPCWFTTAGNPESYELAGRLGVHVLTHLLGQTVSELGDKIAVYRKAWRAHGHPGEGTVSLMIHTFVGDSDAEVKETVRAPMKAYLSTSISLIKGFAETFPTFKQRADGSTPALDFQSLDDEEMDALLEYSFERYYETSSLFGTEATCARIVDRLKGAGVDDIACLVDFGVDTDRVLRHLRHLSRLRLRTARPRTERADGSIAALILRHRVTHLQCTPSAAQLLVDSSAGQEALRSLRTLCIGGEALPAQLGTTLQRLVDGDVHNMYGPTETTVWSTMHTLNGEGPRIPLGGPLANNVAYVLDAFREPVPPGATGELFIGGAQVTRGYLRRPDLTDERFVPDPFRAQQGRRMYRTGDLVRWRSDGKLEFLGRTDQQVKVRGHRVELGEVEAALLHHPMLREAAVTAQPDSSGSLQLIAYVVWRDADTVAVPSLKEQLRSVLPPVMVPARFVTCDALPRTPNGKIDRQRLPALAPVSATAGRGHGLAAASGALEQSIAQVWEDVLQLANVGVTDNFFDLGGHSLLAVKVHSRLKRSGHRELAITDLFRFPTVRSLAAFLSGSPDDSTGRRAQVQAEQRRTLLERRAPLPLR